MGLLSDLFMFSYIVFLDSVIASIYKLFYSHSPQAQKVSDDLMQKISTQNRRALDLIVAKCYYYHSRIYEFLNKLDVVRR